MRKLICKTLFPLAILCSACTKEPVAQTPVSEEKNDYAKEIVALQEEIIALKSQIASLQTQIDEMPVPTSEYNEVEGLLFDKNGEVVSLQVKEDIPSDGIHSYQRTYDSFGRIVKEREDYYHYSEFNGPFRWKETIYTYSGKEMTRAVRVNKYGLAAGTPYEETVYKYKFW